MRRFRRVTGGDVGADHRPRRHRGACDGSTWMMPPSGWRSSVRRSRRPRAGAARRRPRWTPPRSRRDFHPDPVFDAAQDRGEGVGRDAGAPPPRVPEEGRHQDQHGGHNSGAEHRKPQRVGVGEDRVIADADDHGQGKRGQVAVREDAVHAVDRADVAAAAFRPRVDRGRQLRLHHADADRAAYLGRPRENGIVVGDQRHAAVERAQGRRQPREVVAAHRIHDDAAERAVGLDDLAAHGDEAGLAGPGGDRFADRQHVARGRQPRHQARPPRRAGVWRRGDDMTVRRDHRDAARSTGGVANGVARGVANGDARRVAGLIARGKARRSPGRTCEGTADRALGGIGAAGDPMLQVELADIDGAAAPQFQQRPVGVFDRVANFSRGVARFVIDHLQRHRLPLPIGVMNHPERRAPVQQQDAAEHGQDEGAAGEDRADPSPRLGSPRRTPHTRCLGRYRGEGQHLAWRG